MGFLHRSRTPEILDGENFAPHEFEESLLDIARYVRWTGGAGALANEVGGLLSHLPPGSKVRLLDVGTGAAELPALLAASARARGFRPWVAGCDLSARALRFARAREGPSARLSLANAEALPHPDGSFDVAVSSLLLHHLDEAAIARSLSEMRRVTRLGFVMGDLRRSPLALASVWTLTRLTSRNRATLNDGPLSVRRSFTTGELRAIARGAGLERDDGGSYPRGLAQPSLEVKRDGIARLLLVYRHGDGAALS